MSNVSKSIRKGLEEIISTIGRKDDYDKLRYDLFPAISEEEIVKVLTYGAKKYSDDNWVSVPDAENRYYAAARRHLNAWRKGESIDPESGLSHISHAATCLIFLIWFENDKGGKK